MPDTVELMKKVMRYFSRKEKNLEFPYSFLVRLSDTQTRLQQISKMERSVRRMVNG